MRRWPKYVLRGAIVAFLLVLPLLTDSRAVINLFTHVFIFGIFAMSYNLLLGYTGIVSFGHALFFGSGAYLMGLLLKNFGPGLPTVLAGFAAVALFALVVSLIIGVLSLRVRDVYFAMLTLAFGELFFIAALKLRSITGGEDGFSFSVPPVLQDRILYYYMVLFVFVVVSWFLGTFVSSPAGAVLQAIRENEQRAAALGYDVFRYKLLSTVVAGILAGLAGTLYGLQQRFVSASVLALEKTIDALMMTVIGGSGTLFGPVVGAALVSFAQEWFTRLSRAYAVFERWLILFGLIYVLIVLFFPGGILRARLRLALPRKAGVAATSPPTTADPQQELAAGRET
ncbi:MAG: branched-chain amino acid ABC transporter permease [Desulfotomaculales bacterium]